VLRLEMSGTEFTIDAQPLMNNNLWRSGCNLTIEFIISHAGLEKIKSSAIETRQVRKKMIIEM